jgi:hypothetical protein
MRSLLVACGALMLSHTALAEPPPTATEISRLRTQCEKLGKWIFQETSAQELTTFASKYDEKTNHCYVMLTYVYPEQNQLGVPSGNHYALYDGQGGMIAYGSNNYAQIKGEIVSPTVAYDYINKLMEDNPDVDESKHTN